IVSDDMGHTGPARFIFAAESGTISAWSPAVPPPGLSTTAFVMYDGSDEGDIYKGLALATDHKGRARLYATDFHNGRVVVLDDTFNEVHLGKHAFRDRELPHHYAPFGIAAFGDRIFVTYAVQDKDAEDDVAGEGHGIVDEYTLDGDFIRRVASHGPLNSPWGLAVGPKTWGRFEGALLVGNFGNGKIHAYKQFGHEFFFIGTIEGKHDRPLVIPGLWSLMPGNDGQAGSSQDMYFTAGPDDESHGLFGFIERRRW
ncbi:MAG TPA: TIGR03118 family protein, partial [Polyangia bacterium]